MSQHDAATEMLDLSIVIPCHNEEDGLASLDQQLSPVVRLLRLKSRVEIVLVDDGSSDKTWEQMQELARGSRLGGASVRLERHETNRGLGAALRTGFAAAV